MRDHVSEGHVSPRQVFQDIGERYRLDPDQISRGKLLGRGSFGAVFRGTVHDKVRVCVCACVCVFVCVCVCLHRCVGEYVCE